MAPADSDSWANSAADTWGEPGIDSWAKGTEFTGNSGSLISALSRSPAGVTPPKWIVDMAFHEIGQKAHPHIFYLAPKEGSRSGQDPIRASCQTCFKECTIEVSSGNGCTGQMHHLHTTQEAGLIVSECCHCGLTVRAVLEQATIPQSLIYRMRMSRKPSSNNTSAPHFHNTLTMLIRILHDASQTDLVPKIGINTESAAFTSKIGMDDPIKEFFMHARFSFDNQRFHPPDPTPENMHFLSRCCFQLKLLLFLEAPGSLTEPLKPAYPSILERLGGSSYDRDPNEKVLKLSERPTLLAEQHSIVGKLGCLTDMSDSVIIDTFQTQVSHNSATAHALVDALTEIQKKRRSHQLDIEIVCQRSQGIVTTEELSRAYRDFEIPNNGEGIDNDVLVGLIRGSLSSVSKESINIIAQARNDIAINDLVAINDLATIDGPVEEPTLPIQQGDLIMDLYYAQTPVGLSNIGNTCYLNSILQYIYTIKELRETVMNMEMYEEKENEEGWKEKVIDNRIFSRQDVAEAKELVQELRNLFSKMESEKSRSVTPSIRLVELLLPTKNHRLADSSAPPESDRTLQQQDITEALVSLMACFNAAFQPIVDEKNGNPLGRISRMFLTRAFRKGVEENETGAKTEWNIDEDFECIIVAPSEDTTIEELVDDYFGETEADAAVSDTSASSGESQAGPKKRCDITVTELPPFLQIQLNQTQFYREVQSSYKSNTNVAIPKRLFMDQYLEANQEQNSDRIKRLKMWKADRRECRRVLETIKERRKLPASSDSSNADSMINKGSMETVVQTETLSELQHDKINDTETGISKNSTQPSIDAAARPSIGGSYLDKAEAEQLRKIAELTAQLHDEVADMDQAEYKIHAVFHHSGNIDFGHYWVYILDDQSEQPRWFKYSDDLVSEVAQESEVLVGLPGSTICYCVYKRSNADAVQTVWRMIT